MLIGDVDSGNYMVHVYCEITGTLSDRSLAARVLIDGVERGFESLVPIDSDVYHSCNFMGIINLITGEHSVTLQYVSGHSTQTAKIRRARILVIKH